MRGRGKGCRESPTRPKSHNVRACRDAWRSLKLKNPILTASGTFGYGLEFTDFVDLGALGGICTKGLSLEPHAGNAPPRICETPAGMLNAIGLQNVGIEAFLNEKLPRLRELGVDGDRRTSGAISKRTTSRSSRRSRARRARGDRAQHLLPERRNRAECSSATRRRHGVARRPGPGGDAAAADRQALAQRARSCRVRARGPGRRRGRPLARQHVRRHGDRSGDGPAPPLLRDGRPLGPGDQAPGASAWCTRWPAPCRAFRSWASAGSPTSTTSSSSWPRARRPFRSGRPTSGTPGSRGGWSASSTALLLEPRCRPPRSSSAARTAPARRGRSRGGGMSARRGGPSGSASHSTFRAARRSWRPRARFAPRVGWLKIGLEAFVARGTVASWRTSRRGGPGLPRSEAARHSPHGRARGRAAAARSGASMVNVHASGGRAMLLAAREALAGRPVARLIAVTLLTSLDARALADLPMAGHPEGIVRRLARARAGVRPGRRRLLGRRTWRRSAPPAGRDS